MSLRVDVRDYGAVGDGVTDDTDAINSAIDAVNPISGAVFVSRGTYKINHAGLHPLRDRVRLVGDNSRYCILSLGEAPDDDFIRGEGSGWGVFDLTIDANEHIPVGDGASINGLGTHWTVSGCNINNVSRIGVRCSGEHFNVLFNQITKPTPSAAYFNASVAFVDAPYYQVARFGIVQGNTCTGSGIGGQISESFIEGNHVTGSGYISGIFTEERRSDLSTNMVIADNVCSNGIGQVTLGFVYVTSGIILFSSHSFLSNNTCHNNDGNGITLSGQYGMVRNNTSYDNGAAAVSGHTSGIRLLNISNLENASHSRVQQNVAYDTRWPGGTQTQEWGSCQDHGLVSVIYDRNEFSHNKLGTMCRER